MYGEVIRCAACSIIAAIVAWSVAESMGRAEVATLRAEHATAAKDASDAARKLGEDWARKADAQRLVINEKEKEANAKLATLEADNERLRACVAAGTCGLRYAAPARPRSVSNAAPATAAACHGDGTPGELDDVARQAYFSLRSGIQREAEKLRLCQAYIDAAQ